VDFGVLGVDLSRYDVVMSLLRLQQASKWTPHPYWMYTKPFGTLICCVWACGATLAFIHLCRAGVDFEVLGVDLSPYDVVMSLLRLQQASDWDPTSILDVYKAFWYLDMLCIGIWIWGHPCIHAPLQVRGVDFGILGVDLSPCDVVMSKLRPQQASDWILHHYIPYGVYTKYLGTLICCI
jgi:hypothetical protein